MQRCRKRRDWLTVAIRARSTREFELKGGMTDVEVFEFVLYVTFHAIHKFETRNNDMSRKCVLGSTNGPDMKMVNIGDIGNLT